MKSKGMVDKMESTKIDWNDGCDPTKKKVQKKKKGKKVKMEVKQESFFNFFTDEPEEKDKGEGKEDEDEFEDPEDALKDEHGEMAEWFKDDLVPLALEYYLGVIEADADDEDDEFGGDDDSDDDGAPKKKAGKKGKGKGGMPDEKDCK